MTYVVTEPCIGVKDASCVAVCPVDCIHDIGVMVVIDPAECIDCGACVSECPVEAIHRERDVPTQMTRFVELGTQFATDPAAARRRLVDLIRAVDR
jgi:ferredoxin